MEGKTSGWDKKGGKDGGLEEDFEFRLVDIGL